MCRVKHKRLSGVCLLLCFVLVNINAQHPAAYWVTFKDKNNSPYSINNPSQFLSPRAIDRRIKNRIEINFNDLPVNKAYVDSLTSAGVLVMYTSRWFNAATIVVTDESNMEAIENFTFVKTIIKSRDASLTKSSKHNTKNDVIFSNEATTFESGSYGDGFTQIKQLNGQFLHNKGFKGKNIQIALIDAGFKQANEYKGLSNVWYEKRVLGTRDFVSPGNNVYSEHMHGAAVLSTIASNVNGTLIGTAPDASFWLLRSEDTKSEYPVEGDNWIAAAEFADSAGVDIISTSLGYTTFDNPLYNLTHSNLNGQTARISKAATIAASKGIIVLNSAGNDGNDAWHYIGSPADAIDVLAVGALDADARKSIISSFGPSSDGRVKPEIMAMGQSVTAETSPDIFSKISGTSFSCPIMAGAVACLVQAFPNATAKEIKEAVLASSSQYNNPDSLMGYGIPNMETAFNILKESKTFSDKKHYAYPNPFTKRLIVRHLLNTDNEVVINCYDGIGKLVFTQKTKSNYVVFENEIVHLPQGLYLFRCTDKHESVTIKAFKLNE